MKVALGVSALLRGHGQGIGIGIYLQLLRGLLRAGMIDVLPFHILPMRVLKNKKL